jgi:hypothetical protein
MVEAKKTIVFTSGRLGTCFVKKIFFACPKENGLAAGGLKGGRDQSVSVRVDCYT